MKYYTSCEINLILMLSAYICWDFCLYYYDYRKAESLKNVYIISSLYIFKSFLVRIM